MCTLGGRRGVAKHFVAFDSLVPDRIISPGSFPFFLFVLSVKAPVRKVTPFLEGA